VITSRDHAKISASHVDGFVLIDRFSWDAYNETSDLEGQAEAFRKRFGHYPSSIHADKIYQTRSNRAWCKDRDIRLSGKPLGRPRELTREEKRQQRQDEKDRIPIEGKFGNAKRKGTLQRIMAKLAVTSRTVVSIGLISLNLDAMLRFLRALIRQWCVWQTLDRAPYRAYSSYRRLLAGICAPAMNTRAAA